jgi:hypothetical protein
MASMALHPIVACLQRSRAGSSRRESALDQRAA